MTTEKKIQLIFASLEHQKTVPGNSKEFSNGISHAMDVLKIWFDNNELKAAGIDSRLQYEIDKENNTKN